MNDGRKADLEHLRNVKPKNALQARKIREAGEKIRKQQQDKYVREGREAMIKEYKQGRYEDAKYVSDYLIKHEKSGFGDARISLTGLGDRYREIFGHD